MTDIVLLITAGDGPRECTHAAKGVARAYVREARAFKIQAKWLDCESDRSYLLQLSGPDIDRFVSDRTGTVQWISLSPFRPRHKRKNWFVGVYLLPRPDDVPDLHEKDVTFTATRASGPGGQHVNKTNSAVRAVHVPTGISVTAQEERSQHANKKLCMIKLAAIFAARNSENHAKSRHSIWTSHKSLERGNPVRVYVGEEFRLKT